MLKSLSHTVVILLLFAVFAGCENNNLFLTKAGIDSKLQGKWSMVKIPVTEEARLWEFNNGKLYVTYYDSSNVLYRRDTATYEIVARITTPYLVLSDPIPSQYVTGRWIVINIDDKYLTLNRQSDNTQGTKQREFVKQ